MKGFNKKRSVEGASPEWLESVLFFLLLPLRAPPFLFLLSLSLFFFPFSLFRPSAG